MKPQTATATSQQSKSLATRNYTNRLKLLNIGPWSWFIIDYTIAYACAAFAFWLTPYSLAIQNESIVGEHIGQMGFGLGFALCLALVAHIAGLHEPAQKYTSIRLLSRCAMVALAAVLLLNIELLLVHYYVVGRLITFITFVSCTIGLFTFRSLVVELTDKHVVGFVGSQEFIDRAPGVDTMLTAQGVRTVSLLRQGDTGASLLEWANKHGVSEIVVDPEDNATPSETELLGLVNSNFLVTTYTNFVEKLYQRVPNDHITAKWIIDSQADQTVIYNSAIKRAIDIVVASIALMILSPIVLLATICIKLDSAGPVIFRQTRVGQFGELFTMYKLRTMVQHAEAHGAQWAQTSDVRITRVGRILRRTRVDEIPQLLNVLMGEMSLVGPRPERPEFTAELESRIPFFVHRVLVKPGITGWAQVNAGYAASEAEAANKLSFDLYYIKNMSFGLDLRVLLRTISSFADGSR